MKRTHTINVTKASGDSSPFSEEKLRHSLQAAGASNQQVDFIIREISNTLYEGMTTKKIYRMAFSLLKDGSKHMAARYHLKQAIMELGPSGFPFEKYVAEILNYQGYLTQVGQFVKGKCIMHEIDVVAEKEGVINMLECKFHNQAGKFNDVQIPLYVQSRFKDVEEQWLNTPSHKGKTHRGWVVSNTRFSTAGIQYANCAGLKLLGWDHPINHGLKDQIDALGLYPVTCLTTLTHLEKQSLLNVNIVLCKEIYNNKQLLLDSGVKPSRVYSVMKEAEQLCQHLLENEESKS
jgi:Holliday junction resolvase-like predicted endonuclease